MTKGAVASLEQAMLSGDGLPDEVVFADPWQAHAFAMVLALAERGSIQWESFRRRLIAEIARADTSQPYYEAWLRALESSLAASSLLTRAEIDGRAEIIAANPPAPTKATFSGPVRIA